jgi:hypothetical protein
MDFGDIGQEATEARTAELIQAARAAASKTLEVTGFCRNPMCEDDTDKVFCSPECRDEFDRIQLLKKRTQ